MSSEALPRDGCFYVFDQKQLDGITEGWAHEKGSGSFGVVYKGWLPQEYGGMAVAVKKPRE